MNILDDLSTVHGTNILVILGQAGTSEGEEEVAQNGRSQRSQEVGSNLSSVVNVSEPFSGLYFFPCKMKLSPTF